MKLTTVLKSCRGNMQAKVIDYYTGAVYAEQDEVTNILDGKSVNICLDLFKTLKIMKFDIIGDVLLLEVL